jgi:acetolactate synthase-1/3 small subunit
MTTPTAYGVGHRHHIITVLVENKAGVLARVAGLFSRRGYNIFSLAVAPTDDDRLSRITIVVDVESSPLEQLILATVQADPAERAQVIQLVGVFEGQIVGVGHDRVTVMLAGPPEALDDFEELIRPYGITELQRTGRIALPKLERGGRHLRSVSEA